MTCVIPPFYGEGHVYFDIDFKNDNNLVKIQIEAGT